MDRSIFTSVLYIASELIEIKTLNSWYPSHLSGQNIYYWQRHCKKVRQIHNVRRSLCINCLALRWHDRSVDLWNDDPRRVSRNMSWVLIYRWLMEWWHDGNKLLMFELYIGYRAFQEFRMTAWRIGPITFEYLET